MRPDYTGPERRARFRVSDPTVLQAEHDYLAKELGDLGKHIADVEKRMIDPREFGRLESKVETLATRMDDMSRDVKELLELANRSRGGMWAGMAIASALSAVASWVAGRFVH